MTVIKPTGELYGVYIPEDEIPQAQFRKHEDALEWGHTKYGGNFYLLMNYTAYLDQLDEEQQEALKNYDRPTKTS